MKLVRIILFLLFFCVLGINSAYAATCYVDFIGDVSDGFSAEGQYINSPSNFNPTGEHYPAPNPNSASGDRVRMTISDTKLGDTSDNKITMYYFAYKDYRAVSAGSNLGCAIDGEVITKVLTSETGGALNTLTGGYRSTDLNGGICDVQFSGTTPSIPDLALGQSYSLNLPFISSLKAFTHSNGAIAFIPNGVGSSNYNMNAQVQLIIKDGSGGISEITPPINVTFSPGGTRSLTLNIPSTLPPGNYDVFYKVDYSSEVKCQGKEGPGSEFYLSSFKVNSNPAQPANCLLDGINVTHSNNYPFFLNSSVKFGQTCDQLIRTCTNGTLSGSPSYKHATCTRDAPDIHINTNENNVDLSTKISGPLQPIYTVLIDGARIGSTDPTLPALTTGSMPPGSEVIIFNRGEIRGAGGIGGNSVHIQAGEPGRRGGTAIELTVPTKISNEGLILSGGGGGGAGGAGRYCAGIGTDTACTNTNYGAAGAGGGGAGLIPGQPGVTAVSDDNPTSANYAKVGTVNAPGAGGGAGKDAGLGGAGGAPGQAGEDGQDGDYRNGAQGGPPGPAVITNSNSLNWINPGQQGTYAGPIVPTLSSAASCNFLSQVIPPLSFVEFYKRPINDKQRSCEEFRMEARCGYAGLHFVNHKGIQFSNYTSRVFPTCTDLPPDFHDGTNETENADGNFTFEEDDNTTVAKVVVDPVQNVTTFIDTTGTEVNITLPVADPTKVVNVYKNGVLQRQDLVDPRLIALKSHKVKKFKTKAQIEQFVDEVYDLMTKFSITKNLTYDNSSNKTSVKISLSDIPANERLNLTIYKVISKDEAESVDNITFINDGGGERIVVDADPVIGWYFNESEGDEEIEFEVDGDGEGGSIIITYEPILYNEGALIFNYRETGCNVGEVALFELEDLEDSRIHPVGSGELYTVCASHLNETLQNNSLGYLDQHLFLYANSSNMSYDNSLYSSIAQLSVDNTSKIYWDMKLQTENPNGEYSCLGSIENSSNSLFGDCGYSLDRIWVHLAPDELAPETTAQYPFVGHTIKVTLIPQDNVGGSGIDQTYYCFDDDNTCTPTNVYSEPVTVSCPYDWGCTKYIRFYSTDVDGNVESVQSEILRLIDKGSACQESCVATPTPNRFLKECRNINNCEYKDLGGDGGETIAERCDLLVQGSYVTYDSENDVLCPNGPLRKSRFTSFDIDIEETVCENLLAIPYVGVLEGATVVLKVLTCQDE